MDRNHIAREREKRGWTQQELAERADVSLHTVFRAEKGNNIQVGSLQKMAAAFNMSVSDLLEDKPSLTELPVKNEVECQVQKKDAQFSQDTIIYEYVRDKETLRLIFPSHTSLKEMEEKIVVLIRGTFQTRTDKNEGRL